MSRRVIAMLLVGALSLSGCTSVKTINVSSPGEPPFGPIQAGDTVVVQTHAGARTQFVVRDIDGETLIASDGRRYARSDLTSVQRKALSGPKTAGLVAAIAAGAFVVVAVTVGRWLGENSR